MLKLHAHFKGLRAHSLLRSVFVFVTQANSVGVAFRLLLGRDKSGSHQVHQAVSRIAKAVRYFKRTTSVQ